MKEWVKEWVNCVLYPCAQAQRKTHRNKQNTNNTHTPHPLLSSPILCYPILSYPILSPLASSTYHLIEQHEGGSLQTDAGVRLDQGGVHAHVRADVVSAHLLEDVELLHAAAAVAVSVQPAQRAEGPDVGP